MLTFKFLGADFSVNPYTGSSETAGAAYEDGWVEDDRDGIMMEHPDEESEGEDDARVQVMMNMMAEQV